MAENWYEALSDELTNGVSATDAVGSVLGGPAGMAKLGMSAAARLGEGHGGSWSFDEEEIDAVIADWKALAEELEADKTLLAPAQQGIHAPSNDQPSVEFMNALHEGMDALAEFNNSMRDYVKEFVAKLEAAKKSIAGVDGDSADSFGGVSDV
ncbi:hypothetical protein AB8O38_06045 [Saccharomonospora xinjiangensis]|uniref:hypothetical protein n=1 Tax=Saccharomonospora xinjiangensis TaxID=75294 RepID=UPI00350FAF2B